LFTNAVNSCKNVTDFLLTFVYVAKRKVCAVNLGLLVEALLLGDEHTGMSVLFQFGVFRSLLFQKHPIYKQGIFLILNLID